ncbi:hypothetical protein P7C70_g9388, partial [Phenoliferia sp. Uapishka_3]
PYATPLTSPRHSSSSSTFSFPFPRGGPSSPRLQAEGHSGPLQSGRQGFSEGAASEAQRIQVAQDGVTHDWNQNYVDRGAGDDIEGGPDDIEGRSENDLLASKLSGRESPVSHSNPPSKRAKVAVDSPDTRSRSELHQAEQASSSSKTGWSSLANELQAKIMRLAADAWAEESVPRHKIGAFTKWACTRQDTDDPAYTPGPPPPLSEHQETVCEDKSRRDSWLNFMLVQKGSWAQRYAQEMFQKTVLLHGNAQADARINHILSLPAGSRLRTERLKIISRGRALDRPTLLSLLDKFNPLKELFISANRFQTGTPPYSIDVVREDHLAGMLVSSRIQILASFTYLLTY